MPQIRAIQSFRSLYGSFSLAILATAPVPRVRDNRENTSRKLVGGMRHPTRNTSVDHFEDRPIAPCTSNIDANGHANRAAGSGSVARQHDLSTFKNCRNFVAGDAAAMVAPCTDKRLCRDHARRAVSGPRHRHRAAPPARASHHRRQRVEAQPLERANVGAHRRGPVHQSSGSGHRRARVDLRQ